MTLFLIGMGLFILSPFLGINTKHMADERDKTTLSNISEELRNRR